LERSSQDNTDQHNPPGLSVSSEGKTGVKKEREIKEDGRYLIYYDFEDEGERESRGS
jgi:hypothetical protein